MMHVNEGLLLALRDGESVTEEALSHVEMCAVCSSGLEEVSARAALIREMLEEEVPAVDLEAAKAAVRARLDRSRTRSRVPFIVSSVRRAAAILLVAAGAVSAFQAPSVRSWLSERFGDSGATGPGAGTAPRQAEELQSVGIAARPGLVIALTGLDAGHRVALVFEVRDEVEVSAAEGTRFVIADARIDASDVVGPVVIRVPVGAPALMIMANGRIMFTGTDAEYDVDSSGVQADGGWIFRAPDA